MDGESVKKEKKRWGTRDRADEDAEMESETRMRRKEREGGGERGKDEEEEDESPTVMQRRLSHHFIEQLELASHADAASDRKNYIDLIITFIYDAQ